MTWRSARGLLAGLVGLVSLLVAVELWGRTTARDEERDRRGVVLAVMIENPVGERVETRYVLHVDGRDARRLGLADATIPDRFGTFGLDLAAEIGSRDSYRACLEHEAVVTRNDVEVGALPAGTCMSAGTSHRPASVRVRA